MTSHQPIPPPPGAVDPALQHMHNNNPAPTSQTDAQPGHSEASTAQVNPESAQAQADVEMSDSHTSQQFLPQLGYSSQPQYPPQQFPPQQFPPQQFPPQQTTPIYHAPPPAPTPPAPAPAAVPAPTGRNSPHPSLPLTAPTIPHPHGGPTRLYLNQNVTPYLLEAMKHLVTLEPEKPLKWLSEFLAQKSLEIEGP